MESFFFHTVSIICFDKIGINQLIEITFVNNRKYFSILSKYQTNDTK